MVNADLTRISGLTCSQFEKIVEDVRHFIKKGRSPPKRFVDEIEEWISRMHITEIAQQAAQQSMTSVKLTADEKLAEIKRILG